METIVSECVAAGEFDGGFGATVVMGDANWFEADCAFEVSVFVDWEIHCLSFVVSCLVDEVLVGIRLF